MDLAGNLIEEVEGIGENYRIKFNRPLSDVVETIVKNATRIDVDAHLSTLIAELKAIQMQSQRKVREALEILRNRKAVSEYINDLRNPGHAVRAGEGRGGSSRRKRIDTVYLCLSPYLGKYLGHFYKYHERPYRACILCRGLSLYGLHKTYSLALSRQQKVCSFIVIPAFTGHVEGKHLFNLVSTVNSWRKSRFTQYLKSVLDKVDTRNFIYLAFINLSHSLLEVLAKSNASWYAISTKFEIGRGTQIKQRSAQEVRGFNVIQLDPLLSILSELSEEDYIKLCKTLEDIVDKLRYDETSSDAMLVISSLFKALVDRDIHSFYSFARCYEVLRRRVETELKRTLPHLSIEFTKNLVRILVSKG